MENDILSSHPRPALLSLSPPHTQYRRADGAKYTKEEVFPNCAGSLRVQVISLWASSGAGAGAGTGGLKRHEHADGTDHGGGAGLLRCDSRGDLRAQPAWTHEHGTHTCTCTHTRADKCGGSVERGERVGELAGGVEREHEREGARARERERERKRERERESHLRAWREEAVLDMARGIVGWCTTYIL